MPLAGRPCQAACATARAPAAAQARQDGADGRRHAAPLHLPRPGIPARARRRRRRPHRRATARRQGAAVHARCDSGRGHRRLPAAPRVGARTHRRAARAALPGVGVLRVHRQRRRLPARVGGAARSRRRWAWRRLGVRPPKALFTIPSFHNPTTASASLAALRAVYAACAAHGVVIIEDDPYRMLAFGGEDPLAAEDAGAALPGTERAGLPPSFLSVDTDGRVVRCDTFSKWVSPGLRCGFVTAPRPLIVKLAQGAGPSLGVSSPVQVFLVEMLRRWGPAGLHRHAAYRRRCAVALTAAAEHLSGLARWEAPRGGTLLGAGCMFLWLELLGVRSSADLLDEMTRERVCVVPGAFFSAHETPPDTPFVRVSF
ncbi:Kynurenine/alpha-aminoadipate aminotransferase, partial [Emiliania huxleyi CCMP1516]|uniref:Aminotransferase class I/classII large domain-containing protein n=2 Tax=Emiliania huxleyi TaxID=2903 RepID=A0A0D3IFP9_EMIH1